MTTPPRSPEQIYTLAKERVSKQSWRLQQYNMLYGEFRGLQGGAGGGVRGQYGDGRPALQDLSEFRKKLQTRPGAPNWIKPIINDRVAMMCQLPTMTFDHASDSKEDMAQATLASRVIRGQYDLSQMAVAQTHAAFFIALFGETGYTLDPLTPKDAKDSGDPFAVAGIKINVQDPRHCFPRFGTGNQYNRIQDLILYYSDAPAEEVENLHPGAMRYMGSVEKVDVVVFYTTTYKCTVVASGSMATEVYRDDHNYGFCPAEWAINQTVGSQFGVSEVDQTIDLHRNAQALFHLAMDGAIIGTFPPMHVHNAEHVGRIRYGPLAIIETSEDGKVEPLNSNIDINVPRQLLEVSETNLLKQTGTSPMRQDQSIHHANTSGRAINSAMGAQAARNAMGNILLGSALEWVNSKIAMILFKDKAFKNTEMSVYGVEFKGKRSNVTFKGSDLGGLWRNHVQWGDPLGANKHETLVMYLQLFKENLVSARKVLEALGEEDPESLIAEARLDQQQRQALMQAAQAPPGGPPGAGGPPPPGAGGGPTDAAQQGAALAAGGMPGGPAVPGPDAGGAPPGGPPGAVQPPPAGGGGMPGFAPLAAPPNGPPGGATPVPDIWSAVTQMAAGLKLHGEVVGARGTPTGILLTVTDHRDFAILKTAMKPVAEMSAGPGAKVELEMNTKGK